MNSNQIHLSVAIILLALAFAASSSANTPPDFGPNVLIFDPSMTNIQPRIDAIFAQQEKGEFNANRFVYLFKPGNYNLDVQVGFYMQIAGLGQSPDDVNITGAVRSKATWRRGNATVNFWRCAENLSITPTLENKKDVWAVSQGTALRRVHVKGDLNLSDGGWSSGGFIADSQIDGAIDAGSQQQWLTRNSNFKSWRGGGWNMVFVGVNNPPSEPWPTRPYTVVEKTPVIREKPYLAIDATGNYTVTVPNFSPDERSGSTWATEHTPSQSIPIDQFFLAHPTDTADKINTALNSGKNLILTPGIYHLQTAIQITRANTIVLGMGYPTLIPDNGNAAMTVADVDGVSISGILFEAGKTDSQTLLQVGEQNSSKSHANNPTFLYDIFCRAGGANVGTTQTFVTINSNNVVGDNFWLWRADHGKGASWNGNKNAHGLVVNGTDVTLYGLFVEHCQQYQTLWNANGGRVYFYQSEMPYDPPAQSAWSHDNTLGYASYKVADNVTTHQAWGLGIYCVFYAAPILADTAIETPTAPGVQMHHMTTLRLNGRPNSGISHVINNQGEPVIKSKMARVD